MMNRKLLFLTAGFVFAGNVLLAQENISGKIVDQTTNKPIVGATIRNLTTDKVTTSDENGAFSLVIKPGDRIETAFIGYAQNYTIWDGVSALSLAMVASSESIDEIVVTGYGGTTKKAFTGSAAVLTKEQFKNIQATSIGDVLQGNASGVMAISGSGQPGEEPEIRVRGIGSKNASSAPLIILDGAPFEGSLNSINPADIESMTVLKDASATSIYGSRAANGIIQIVTRQGKGEPKIDFSYLVGASSRAVKEYKTVNAKQYYELTWEALRNDAQLDNTLLGTNNVGTAEEYASKLTMQRLVYNPFDLKQPFDANGKIIAGDQLRWESNWMDEMLRTGIRQDMNLNISGGDQEQRTTYFISGGYLKDQGIIKSSDFERFSGRMNLNSKIKDWLRVGVSSSISKSDQNFPYQGTGYGSNVLAFARGIAPIYPVHLVNFETGAYELDANGNKIYDFGNNLANSSAGRPTIYRRPFVEGQNVAGTNELNPVTNGRLTVSGQAFAEVSLHRTLSFRTNYSLTHNAHQNDVFWNPFYGDGTTTNGFASRGITSLYTQNFANTLTYVNTFADLHAINLVVGSEAYKSKSQYAYAARTGFTFSDPKEVSYGTTASSEGYTNEHRLESYFARLGYAFDQKYHLSASFRRDGSTRFHKDNRWGSFYAVGAAWNLDQEDFLKDVSFISDLKLKASYGTSGNEALPESFPYYGTYASGSNIGTNSGSVIKTVPNNKISWEKSDQLDVGVDFGFLRNRLVGSLVYFNRNSGNLLFYRPFPNSTGIDQIADNAGGVKNTGWEFDLTSKNIIKEHFSWSTSFNITKLSNKITKKAPGTTQEVGDSWYAFRLKEYAGMDATDGTPMWYKDDKDGNKVTTKAYQDATFYYIGNELQDYTGGIKNDFRYKQFDLSILASFGLGGEFYDNNYQRLMSGIAANGQNASVDVLDRWQDVSQVGDGNAPRLQTIDKNINASSTRFLYDHTFVRVRNITLGYNVAQDLVSKVKLRNARIYFNVQNPFTYFPNAPKGADPDSGINARAENSNTTPNKFVSFGLNIGL